MINLSHINYFVQGTAENKKLLKEARIAYDSAQVDTDAKVANMQLRDLTRNQQQQNMTTHIITVCYSESQRENALTMLATASSLQSLPELEQRQLVLNNRK